MRYLSYCWKAGIGLLLALVLPIGGLLNLPTLVYAETEPSFTLARMPAVSLAQLPPEAQATISLIRKGGPFPYRQDGTVFRNRERRLPNAPAGYYREYTIKTPGVRGRGAQRIVTGNGGEIYYTPDHYASFVRVR